MSLNATTAMQTNNYVIISLMCHVAIILKPQNICILLYNGFLCIHDIKMLSGYMHAIWEWIHYCLFEGLYLQVCMIKSFAKPFYVSM